MKRVLIALAVMPIGVLGFGVAAVAVPPDPGTAHAVADWVLNGGETELKALGTEFGELAQAANASDLQAISLSCTHLQRDVQAAQDYDPIPDNTAHESWSAALDEYEHGAKDCVTGADNVDSDLLIKASQELIDGRKDLQDVTARLQEISG